MGAVAERPRLTLSAAAEGDGLLLGQKLVLVAQVIGHAEGEAEGLGIGGQFHDQWAVEPAADRHRSGGKFAGVVRLGWFYFRPSPSFVAAGKFGSAGGCQVLANRAARSPTTNAIAKAISCHFWT